jgi:hypothetical protein
LGERLAVDRWKGRLRPDLSDHQVAPQFHPRRAIAGFDRNVSRPLHRNPIRRRPRGTHFSDTYRLIEVNSRSMWFERRGGCGRKLCSPTIRAAVWAHAASAPPSRRPRYPRSGNNPCRRRHRFSTPRMAGGQFGGLLQQAHVDDLSGHLWRCAECGCGRISRQNRVNGDLNVAADADLRMRRPTNDWMIISRGLTKATEPSRRCAHAFGKNLPE